MHGVWQAAAGAPAHKEMVSTASNGWGDSMEPCIARASCQGGNWNAIVMSNATIANTRVRLPRQSGKTPQQRPFNGMQKFVQYCKGIYSGDGDCLSQTGP